MRKKLLILVALGCASLSSIAADFVVDRVTYTVLRAGEVGIKKVDTKSTDDFIIPDKVSNEGVDYAVKTVEDEAFKYCTASTISLPNSIDSIKYCGVYQCANLTNLKLPDNLKFIGDYGLASNKSLTKVTLPSTIKEIPRSCFNTCYLLSDINFPEGLKVIGGGAFYKCAMTNVVLPESLDSIAKTAFLMITKLESVTFPSKLRVINDGAFNGCTALTNVILPASLEYLGDEAFLDCSKITSMNIPAGTKYIGNGAFAKTGITAFTVDAANTTFKAINGVVYTTDKSILYAYPSKGAVKYSVEKGCRGIGGGAFWGSAIQEVTLPDGMRAFDDYAFCESTLAKINFPSSLVYMGEQALAGTSFTSIVLPENMPFVMDGLLAWSKSLTSITIPSGVTNIANHAFQTCSALTEVHCLGSVPPAISDFYDEEDNPFGYISRDKVALTVPAGYKAAYQATDWKSLFSNMSDTEVAPFVPSEITPASESSVKTFEGVTLTFEENATIAKSHPAVTLKKDEELTGSTISVDDWFAVTPSSSNKKVVRIFPADYDGYIAPITFEDQKYYFLTIPAGVFKNASGLLNEKIVLRLIGTINGGVVDAAGAKDCFAVKNGSTLNIVLGSLSDCAVSLYNTNGSLVAQQKNVSGTAAFEVTGANGVYIVKIVSGNTAKTLKIMM